MTFRKAGYGFGKWKKKQTTVEFAQETEAQEEA